MHALHLAVTTAAASLLGLLLAAGVGLAAGIAAGLPAWQPIEMEEMHRVGMVTHPTQWPNGSILMLGARDNDLMFEGKPDLAGVTGLQLEALNDGDLFMDGPGCDGAWAIGRMRVQVRKPDDAKDAKPAEVSMGPVGNLIDGDDQARVEHAFFLCTPRPPTADEKRELLDFLAAQRKRIADGWLDETVTKN